MIVEAIAATTDALGVLGVVELGAPSEPGAGGGRSDGFDIYTKLGIASRVQLVQEAARHA